MYREKVLQYFQSPAAALLRMELTGKKILLLDAGINSGPVLCRRRDNGRVLRVEIITVDKIDMEACVGKVYVAEHHGIVSRDDAAEILKKAKEQDPEAAKRILIKGAAEVSAEAAKVFAASKLLLLGNESQTVGPEDAPMEVHLILLGASVILLEGIRLAEVSEGVYFLSAAPLNLSGADGSPCRAILITADR